IRVCGSWPITANLSKSRSTSYSCAGSNPTTSALSTASTARLIQNASTHHQETRQRPSSDFVTCSPKQRPSIAILLRQNFHL
ncbi:hypothetical protein LTR16_009875, partial [Cryomyces antarcticus]